MDICLLSITEAARLEHYGIWPSCRKGHIHISKKQAEAMIADDTHRYVGGLDTCVGIVTAIVPQLSNEYVWRNVPSGGPLGCKVRQFVPNR